MPGVQHLGWSCSAALCISSLSLVSACGSELGECNNAAANELVYSRTGFVATKGQALTQDSCGNSAFCHSRAAKGGARFGAPASLDFDMLPAPTGLTKLRAMAEESFRLVRDGEMPPSGVGARAVGDGDWRADIQRGPDAVRLPPLSSEKGLAIFRNWLACGAPVVRDTRIPAGLQPASGAFVMAGETPRWAEVYAQIVAPACATAGCHNAASAAGGLSLADECGAITALRGVGSCGKALIVAGDPDASFLVEKLELTTPSCGGAMPPTGSLPDAQRTAVRAFIAAGAEASCP